MLRKLDNAKMGRSNLGWLNSVFHFSFAEYHNPDNIKFGKLRVINDDLVEPNTGFGPHPHRDMEIISYVVKGELTHADSMGNKRTLTRGHAQYMSAGTGIVHSEQNFGKETLRFLQIWIFPDKLRHTPNYGDYEFAWEERKNKWLLLASNKESSAPIKINQDINMYVIELDKDREIDFPVKENRQAYLVQIEGASIINQLDLSMRDGLEVVEEDLKIKAKETSHLLIVEMAKSE